MSLRERKVAKKKEEILKSAASILAEKGYYGTTMEEIAARLLMTKGSIYYYFKDKQDLLYQSQKILLEQSMVNLEEVLKLDLPAKEKLEKAMYVHLEFLISELSTFAMGIKPEQVFNGEYLEDILRLRVEYAKCYDELIAEGIESGDFETVNVRVARNIILGAMNWVVQWYSPEKKDNGEVAEMISEYLLKIVVKDLK